MDRQAGELFEIFDKEGNALGTEKRGIVHRAGVLHKGIHGYLLDEKGRVFIQKRSQEKENEPGKWDASIAEHLKPGESFEDAFKRGVKEELGVEVKEAEKIGERENLFEKGEIHDRDWVGLFKGKIEGEIKLQKEEVSEVKWIGKEELLKEMDETPERFAQWLLGDRKYVELL